MFLQGGGWRQCLPSHKPPNSPCTSRWRPRWGCVLVWWQRGPTCPSAGDLPQWHLRQCPCRSVFTHARFKVQHVCKFIWNFTCNIIYRHASIKFWTKGSQALFSCSYSSIFFPLFSKFRYFFGGSITIYNVFLKKGHNKLLWFLVSKSIKVSKKQKRMSNVRRNW